MKQYTADKIRNVALAGHSSAGKTSLAEMLLFKSGATDRLGKIADGNTVCDFDPEEIKRQVSVSSAIAPFDWNGVKINLLDTPGMFDFAAGVSEGHPCRRDRAAGRFRQGRRGRRHREGLPPGYPHE